MTKPCQSKLQAQAPHCSLIWETLSIAFEGKEERHFPRQFSWIKDSFQPTGSSLITIGGKYLWLFPTIGPSKTSLPPAGNLASHSCCKTPIGDFLRLFAVLWSKIYIFVVCMLHISRLLFMLLAVFWSFRSAVRSKCYLQSVILQILLKFFTFLRYVDGDGLCLLCKMMKVNLDKILGQNMFQRLPKILRIVQLFPPPQSFSDKEFDIIQHDINLACSKSN